MSITILQKAAEFGITFFSITAILYIVCMFNKTLQNHMSHMTEILQKLNASIEILIKVIGNKNM